MYFAGSPERSCADGVYGFVKNLLMNNVVLVMPSIPTKKTTKKKAPRQAFCRAAFTINGVYHENC